MRAGWPKVAVMWRRGTVARCHCVHRLDADLSGVSESALKDQKELLDAALSVRRAPRGVVNGTEGSLRVLESRAIVDEERDHVVRVFASEGGGQGGPARRLDDGGMLGEQGLHAFEVGCVVSLAVHHGRLDELTLYRRHVGPLLSGPVQILNGLPDPFDALFTGGLLSLAGGMVVGLRK